MSPSSRRGQQIQIRIEELAEATGATVRNIRVYQEKGLLPPPVRKGRTAVYSTQHLRRLQEILRLLDRGYTFSTIEELFAAERHGLSVAELIEAEDPRGFRRVSRRRMYSRADAEEMAGFSFSDNLVRIGTEGGLVDPTGEEGYLADTHVYGLFRDLIDLGLTEREVDEITVRVFDGQERTAEAFDILLEAVRRVPAHQSSSPDQLLTAVTDFLPRGASTIRVIFMSMVEQRLRGLIAREDGSPAS